MGLASRLLRFRGTLEIDISRFSHSDEMNIEEHIFEIRSGQHRNIGDLTGSENSDLLFHRCTRGQYVEP